MHKTHWRVAWPNTTAKKLLDIQLTCTHLKDRKEQSHTWKELRSDWSVGWLVGINLAKHLHPAMTYIFSYDKVIFQRHNSLTVWYSTGGTEEEEEEEEGGKEEEKSRKQTNKKKTGCAVESHSGMYQEKTALAFSDGAFNIYVLWATQMGGATKVWEQTSLWVSGLHSAACQFGISLTSWASDYGFLWLFFS